MAHSIAENDTVEVKSQTLSKMIEASIYFSKLIIAIFVKYTYFL